MRMLRRDRFFRLKSGFHFNGLADKPPIPQRAISERGSMELELLDQSSHRSVGTGPKPLDHATRLTGIAKGKTKCR